MLRMPPTAMLVTLLAAFATPANAQLQRVFVNGVPSNLLVNWNGVSAVPDALSPNAFVALMPLSLVSSWATFEPDLSMNSQFGAGNWLRCRMTATDWAYLSPDPCAHLAGSNAGSPYPQPLSLLTSTYDYGPYPGSVGSPHTPIPDVTLFGPSIVSYVEGLGNHWTMESWQLRTRGFQLQDLWNGCAPSQNVTPNFSGWLAARFQFTFF